MTTTKELISAVSRNAMAYAQNQHDKHCSRRLSDAEKALLDHIDSLSAEVEAMEVRKDAAYLERNQLVALVSKLFPSGTKRTAIEGWSDDWHGCVYIDLPTGQASWHYHDSQAHLFAHLPPYVGEWDGHTTEQKYERIAQLEEQGEAVAYMSSRTGCVVTKAQRQRMQNSGEYNIRLGCIATHPAPAAPVVDRVHECAQRLVEHVDFQLGDILSADSKAKEIPSNAVSQVKARHLAALRDALHPTQPKGEKA